MDSPSISIVVPFFDTPPEFFYACLRGLKGLKPFEIIVVDDCSSDEETIAIAKGMGCRYLKTPYQSGSDALPFNMGVEVAKGEYVCRVDSDDLLLELPSKMTHEIHFAYLDRVKVPLDVSVEKLILQPRAICNGMVAKRSLWMRYPYIERAKIYTDVLCAMRMLHNGHSYSVNPRVNYIYRKRKGSIQDSKSHFTHRLTHIQTVAQFCLDEEIDPAQSIHLLELAMLNLKYGSKSIEYCKI